MSRLPAFITLLAALTLTACGSEGAAGTDGPGGSVTGDWTLVEATADGAQLSLQDDRPITLSISGSDATGSSGCNTYFGTVEIDGSTVRFEDLGGTEMACEPDVMELEHDYLTALASVRTASNENEQLVLDGTGVKLRFDPVAPVEPAALVGTSWVLEATIGAGGPGGSASSPVGEPATLELADDGTVTGSTGCNQFGGTYELSGDELTFSALHQTLMACDEDISAQESVVMATLAEPLTVSIDGEMLTLTAPDGSGLVYRVQGGPATDDPVPPAEPTGSATAMVGRTWLLDALLDADGASTPATGAGQLIFADNGTFDGEVDGCFYAGTYAIEGDHVSMSRPSIDGTCPGEPVSTRVFAAQEGGFDPIIDGDSMTIIGPDGTGIVYVVEQPAQ